MKKLFFFIGIIFLTLSIEKEGLASELKSTLDSKDEYGKKINDEQENWHWETMGVEFFHNQNIKGEGVKVAVIEGNPNRHEDFDGKVKEYVNCNTNSIEKTGVSDCEKNGNGGNEKKIEHATEVIGVIASDKVGIAPKTTIYSVSYISEYKEGVLGFGKSEGGVFNVQDDFQRALKWAIEKEVDIISISQAFSKEQFESIAYQKYYDEIKNEEERKEKLELLEKDDYNGLGLSEKEIEELEEEKNILEKEKEKWRKEYVLFEKEVEGLLNEAIQKDIIVLASSGNNENREIFFPAKNEKVLAVGAIMINEGKLTRVTGGNSSTYGEELDFVAPGYNINTTTGIKGYKKQGGTSIATPIVAGYFALLKEYYEKNGENKTNLELVDIAKKASLQMRDFAENYTEKEVEGHYHNTGYGYGLPHGIPQEGSLDVEGTLNYYKYPSENAEIRGQFYGNGKHVINYIKKWNGWYKVKSENGEFVWIKTEDNSNSKQPPITKETSITHSFNGIHDFMNNDGTYTGYIKGGQWVQETKFKSLSYEELASDYTYHPQEEVYKYYGMMASGDFYDEPKLYEDRLAYQRKVYQQEEILYPGMNPWDNSEYYAKNHYYEGDISPYRIDYMNIYNLVLENSKEETYFVPVFSPARFSFDISEQFFGPKTNDYILSDGRISRYITVYALIPSNDFSIFNFREIRGDAQLKIGEMTYDQLGKTNILTILETKLGEQDLKLVDVIYDVPKEQGEIIENPKVWEMTETYQNYNHQTAYENKKEEDRFLDNRRWIQETTFVDIPYEEIDTNYTFHPEKSAYDILKSRFNGDFYDKNVTSEHFLKDKVSDFRLDKNNQHYLIFKNPSGQTYFLPIWTTSLLKFDLEKQTIKPTNSDYTHSNGYGGVYFRVYGLKANSNTSDFNEKEQNSDLLISYYLRGRVITDINSIDIMQHIKEDINMSDGKLVQVISK